MPSLQLPNIKIKPSLDEGTKVTNKTSQIVKTDNSDTHDEFYHIYQNTLQKQQNFNKNKLSSHKQNNKDNNINITSNKTTNKSKIKLDDNIDKNNNKSISKDDIEKYNNEQKDIIDVLTTLINLSFLNKKTNNKTIKTNNKKEKIKIKKKFNLTILNNLTNHKTKQETKQLTKITKLINKTIKINKNIKQLINNKKNRKTIDKHIINIEYTKNVKSKIIVSTNYKKKKKIINSTTTLSYIDKQKNLNTKIHIKNNKTIDSQKTKHLNITKKIKGQIINQIEQTIKYKKNISKQKQLNIKKDKNSILSPKQITEEKYKDIKTKDKMTTIILKKTDNKRNYIDKNKQVNDIYNHGDDNKAEFKLKVKEINNEYKNKLKIKYIINSKQKIEGATTNNLDINNKIINNSFINYINQTILQKSQKIHINNKNIIQQINNFILDNLQNKNIGFNQNTAILQLHPPELGKIKIKLKINNNIVNATFIADHPDIKQILETNIQLLRQQLAQGGLQLNNCFINLNMNSKHFFSDLYKQSSKQNSTTNFDIIDDDKKLSEDITKQLNIKFNLFNQGLHLII